MHTDYVVEHLSTCDTTRSRRHLPLSVLPATSIKGGEKGYDSAMSTKPKGKDVATRKLRLPVWQVLCLAFGMLLGLALNSYAGDASALDPIWSKNAVRLHVECDLGAKPPASAMRQQIPSPNRLVTAEVTCGHSEADDGVLVVLVFELGSPEFQGVDPAKAAQRDMVQRFPRCQARGREPDVCARVLKNPDFNMSAIAWTRGSQAIIVMAEVPCSSRHGGIMCQVQGYELDAHTGRIFTRMSAKDLKKSWQWQMAFSMRIPEPPEFGPP
jgi:hypothetical protein